MSEPFIGEIRMWACDFAPRGWALCDGSLLPIAQHSTLFAIIGTLYGGDGRTTLGLPNLKERTPMHWGLAPGLSPYDIGEVGGESSVTLSTSTLPSHDHVIYGAIQPGTASSPASNQVMSLEFPTGENVFFLSTDTNSNTQLADQELSNSGGGQSHENRQPYLAVNFCIALEGLFPSRS